MMWQPLREELERWEESGKVARFWLRDDDAVTPSPALERLASTAAQHAVTTVLAVIPARADGALADFVARDPHLRIAVHGWSHANHAPDTEKKQELGAHRPAENILAELTRGLEKLSGQFGHRLLPMLVPPWNRIDTSLLPRLRACGFWTLSVFGPADPRAPIAMINTHVDLIDWRGDRQGRDWPALIAAIVRELQRRREGRDEPLGILSHHLVSDDRVFGFVEELLSVTAAHAACRWLGPRELV